MSSSFNPKREAQAFRIWRAATAKNWETTTVEIAKELDLPVQAVARTCGARGWQSRLRTMEADHQALQALRDIYLPHITIPALEF